MIWGSFVGVPNSANIVKENPELWLEANQGKYVTKGDKSGLLFKYAQQIPLKKGDMVIWNIATAHANYMATYASKPRINHYFTYIPAQKWGRQLCKRNAIDYVKSHPEFKKKLNQHNWTSREQQLLGLKKY